MIYLITKYDFKELERKSTEETDDEFDNRHQPVDILI